MRTNIIYCPCTYMDPLVQTDMLAVKFNFTPGEIPDNETFLAEAKQALEKFREEHGL